MATLAEVQYVSIQESLPVVERMIAAAICPDLRAKLVVRLARFDQEIAALRDKLGKPGFQV